MKDMAMLKENLCKAIQCIWESMCESNILFKIRWTQTWLFQTFYISILLDIMVFGVTGLVFFCFFPWDWGIFPSHK